MQRRRFLSLLLLPPIVGVTLPVAARNTESLLKRRIRFTYSFSNPFDRGLENQVFWCYLPAVIGSTQKLSQLQISSPYRVLEDPLGHRILELPFDHFPPYGQKVVTVLTEVEFTENAQAETLAQRSEWLKAERFIESDDPRIRALAAALRKPTALETMRAIYDWVRTNLHYAGYVAEDLGAIHAMLQRSGDCTEYADLVVALARANGIPGRMVGGYVLDRDAAPKSQDYHNWAEVYIDGGWRLIDAQKENWLEPDEQYVVFRIYRDVPTNPVGGAHRYLVQGDLRVTF